MKIIESPKNSALVAFPSGLAAKDYLEKNRHVRIICRTIYPLSRIGEVVLMLEYHEIGTGNAFLASQAADLYRAKARTEYVKSNNDRAAARLLKRRQNGLEMLARHEAKIAPNPVDNRVRGKPGLELV